MSPHVFQPRVLKRIFNQGIPLATPSSLKKEHSMKRACSLFLILLLALFLNGCGDSDDPTDVITGAADAKTPPTTTTGSSGYSKSETFSATGVAHAHRGRGSTFRINKQGPAFGKSIKVVFSNGWSIVVPDTSRRYASGNFIYRPGIGSVRSGTGTAHGGVFIAANTGNKSKTVKIYYNK